MPPDNNSTNYEGVSKYTAVKEDVPTGLDPDLQSIILARREGRELPKYLVETVSEGDQQITAIDVIARLKNAGEKVPGLFVVQEIGPFVTGLVDVDRIAEVRKKVVSLKAARRVTASLASSVPEIKGTPAQIRTATERNSVDGSNVIIGIVDYGCDFAHPNFKKLDEANKTRLLFLWDQRGGYDTRSPQDFGYGREFDTAAINNALENANPADGPSGPHIALGYALNYSHGTQVMDIAAGNGGGINPPGVAPGADIIFVESSLEDLQPGQSFGNSRHLVDAVQYIFNRAASLNRPAVVNISLSLDAGPHDGSTPVEQAFDYMLQTPGRAIVMAAGNSCYIGKHLRRRIYPGGITTLVWNIPPNDQTKNKVELWYTGRHALELTLRFTPAVGPEIVIGPFSPDTTHTIHKTVGNQDQVAGNIFHRREDPGNGDNNIVVEFEPIIELGDWKLELNPTDPPGYPAFEVDAWIERDGGAGALFPEQQREDSLCSIGTLACGVSTIAVSAYDSFEPHGILSVSGAGPTRDGKLKPEVSAPGINIKAAQIRTTTVAETGGGTSSSAPHVTGLIALIMQRARTMLTIEQTRSLLVNSIRKSPPSPSNAWDPRFGTGRINASASLVATPLPPPPPPAPPAIVVVDHQSLVAIGAVALNDNGVGAPEGVLASVGISIETASTVVAPLLSGSTGIPPANGDDANGNGAGYEDEEEEGHDDGELHEEEPPPTQRPVTSGH